MSDHSPLHSAPSQDVHSRDVAALDALRESEARFRATFERAPVGLARMWDSEANGSP